MAAQRRQGRSRNVHEIASTALTHYGTTVPWTVLDLKRQNVKVGGGVINFMHSNGFIRKNGVCRLSGGNYILSRWILTMKGRRIASSLG